MKLIISACLLGCNCRYDGKNNCLPSIERLSEKYTLIPICPEILGGLSTPRTPSECIENKVFSKDGKNVTENFIKGANEALHIAEICGCKTALLKERSPSCGYGKIYDGTFSGKLISRSGVTASLFLENGIRIYGESQIEELL